MRIGRKGNDTEIVKRIYRILGDKCARCGFTDIRALEIDHIKGDSSHERRRYSVSKQCWVRIGTSSLYRKILKKILHGGKDDYQLLCANCHAIKTIENKEWGSRNYKTREEKRPMKNQKLISKFL